MNFLHSILFVTNTHFVKVIERWKYIFLMCRVDKSTRPWTVYDLLLLTYCSSSAYRLTSDSPSTIPSSNSLTCMTLLWLHRHKHLPFLGTFFYSWRQGRQQLSYGRRTPQSSMDPLAPWIVNKPCYHHTDSNTDNIYY